jgi:PAS domain S-box-containing protein
MPNPKLILRRLQPRSLDTLLALAFIVLSIVLTLVLVTAIERKAVEQIRGRIGQGLAELALQTSDKLERGMFERYREVGLLAQRHDLQPGVPVAQRRAVLDQVQASYDYYSWIGMAGVDGKVQVAAKGLLEGVDVSARPWFHRALNGLYAGNVHEAVLLAKKLPAADEPWRFVDLAFPFLDEAGKPRGVLGVHLSWQWARDVERSTMAGVAARRKAEALIVDADRFVILGPKAWVGKQLDLPSLQSARDSRDGGYDIEAWPDGHSYLVGYARGHGYERYPGLGWTVLVRQNVDDAYAPARRLRDYGFAAGILLAGLCSIAGIVIARRITQPLGELASSARRIAHGETVQIEPGRRSYEEVRALSSTLNTLVSALVQRRHELEELNATLEQRVEQRTRELEDALVTVRASEQRIATIIEAAQDAFVGVDLHGNVCDWNTQAQGMFGWRRDEVVGRPVAQVLVPPRFHPSVGKAIGQFVQTGRSDFLERHFERAVVDRHGREFLVEVTAGLAGSGDSAFFSIFMRDISERKKVERMKSEFVSTVSHELRTPLTSIRASLSMLADGMAGELAPDVQGLVDISYQSCERLVRLVSDVLDIQKIEAGRMDFAMREQPLLALAEHALAAMQGYAQQHGVALASQLDKAGALVALVDGDRITQVLTNLLSNAVKFSPQGAQVLLELHAVGGRARIAVKDHGSGIPADFTDRIFQPFAQADGADSRQKGGTGLGLSICKSIVEQHGGSISFTTRPGAGTTFIVELPLAG